MAIRTAIIVEGGAMRGIFSAGVLDVLLEQGLVGFDLAIGTSAGSCNLASFLARQHERNLRCYVDIMARGELFSARRMMRGGHYMDLDWLWQAFVREEPLDEAAIARSGTQFVTVATCSRNGRAVYQTQRAPRITEGLKAGCALPLLYRGPVSMDGELLVDGGLTDPIPVREAYRRGARRLLVIRSRPSHVVKKAGPLDAFVAALLRRHPAVAKAARDTPERYREAVGFIHRPPLDAHVLELAPEKPLRTSRTTQDRATLRRDYALGRRVAQRHLPRIRALLEAEPSSAARASA